jgi:hypothetical protein
MQVNSAEKQFWNSDKQELLSAAFAVMSNTIGPGSKVWEAWLLVQFASLFLYPWLYPLPQCLVVPCLSP